MKASWKCIILFGNFADGNHSLTSVDQDLWSTWLPGTYDMPNTFTNQPS